MPPGAPEDALADYDAKDLPPVIAGFGRLLVTATPRGRRGFAGLEPAAPAVSAGSPSRPPPSGDAAADDSATTVEVVEPPARVPAETALLQRDSPPPEGLGGQPLGTSVGAH